jgi:hypothetical protein
LEIAGASAQDEKQHWPQLRRRSRTEVVQLDQRRAGLTRADDNVLLPLGGFVEDSDGVAQS